MTGDIDRSALGFTYSHEHLIGSPPPPTSQTDPDLVILDFDNALAEAETAKSVGVRSLYEASAWDYGRNPAALRRISEAAGLQIIGCAGFNKGEWFDERLRDWPVERLEEQITTDVMDGMEGTDVRGGVIKFGTGYNHISPVEERVIRAAARAHRRTGATLHGHTETGTMVPEQIEILRDEGVDLRRVGFVHLMRNPDSWLHKSIAQTGAYLCCDGFSKIKYHPESVRIDLIVELIEAGYQRQLLIGGDLARRSDLSSYTGGPGLGYIAGKWLPRFRLELAERGYSPARVEEICTDLFVSNPAGYFDMVAPY
ncbi:MAG: phosphotriesterase family protein [Trebonia sp.]